MRTALKTSGAHLLLVERAAADKGWGALLGGRVLTEDGSPVVDLGMPDWDSLMRSWSGNLRKQLGKHERRLERDPGLRYRLALGPEALGQNLELLFSLHGELWPDGESSFVGAHNAFHRDFLRLAAERDWLRLWVMEADGRPVAAELVLRFGDADSSFQSGRDPSWQPESLGILLTARAIRAALEDGMSEYRLLRGDEAYKYRFARRDPGVETIGGPERAAHVGRAGPSGHDSIVARPCRGAGS